MADNTQDKHEQSRPSEEFICGECGAEFDTENKFRQHMEREHGTEI